MRLIKNTKNNWDLLSKPLQKDCEKLENILSAYLQKESPADAKGSKMQSLVSYLDNAMVELFKAIPDQNKGKELAILNQKLSKTLILNFITANTKQPYASCLKKAGDLLLNEDPGVKSNTYYSQLREWFRQTITEGYQRKDNVRKMLPWVISCVLLYHPKTHDNSLQFISKVQEVISNSGFLKQCFAKDEALLSALLQSFFSELAGHGLTKLTTGYNPYRSFADNFRHLQPRHMPSGQLRNSGTLPQTSPYPAASPIAPGSFHSHASFHQPPRAREARRPQQRTNLEFPPLPSQITYPGRGRK